jgi:hypothetical protein
MGRLPPKGETHQTPKNKGEPAHMKINIYAEDLTHNIYTERHQATDGKEYIALRFALRPIYNQNSLHKTPEHAHSLTLWSTARPQGGHAIFKGELANLLETAVRLLRSMTENKTPPETKRARDRRRTK